MAEEDEGKQPEIILRRKLASAFGKQDIVYAVSRDCCRSTLSKLERRPLPTKTESRQLVWKDLGSNPRSSTGEELLWQRKVRAGDLHSGRGAKRA